MDDLLKKFALRIRSIPSFEVTLSLVRRISKGKVWLVGGAAYQSIVHELYGLNFIPKDFDFLVEELNTEQFSEKDVIFTKNSFGNIKIKYKGIEIDVVPLNNVHSIQERGLLPTIENYLSGTPLSIQSIAFDIDKNVILGEVGIQAILQRKIEVQNKEGLFFEVERKGLTIEKYIQDVRLKVGF